MSFVRTMLGDLPPELLGPTDYHEHLFQATPLLPGDELDDERASRTETGLLFAAGITAMVEATPVGLSRDPAAVAQIGAATGMRVVATTGAHRKAHYGPDHPLVTAAEADLAARFRAGLVDGCPARDVGSTPGGTAVASDRTLPAVRPSRWTRMGGRSGPGCSRRGSGTGRSVRSSGGSSGRRLPHTVRPVPR